MVLGAHHVHIPAIGYKFVPKGFAIAITRLRVLAPGNRRTDRPYSQLKWFVVSSHEITSFKSAERRVLSLIGDNIPCGRGSERIAANTGSQQRKRDYKKG